MTRVSTRPWAEVSRADYTPDQWRTACLIDTGAGGPDSRDRYAVAVREPNGDINRGACDTAASADGIMAVRGVSPEAKQAAARQLVSLYRNELDQEPPVNLVRMAGMTDTDLRGDVNGQAPPASPSSHYRSFNPDLQVRSGGDGRTVYGIAVPYNAPVRIDEGLVEQFARGAFNHQLNAPGRVKFARDHMMLGGTLIGAATLLRDDASGLYVELRASRTPTGDETLELIRDGALDELSIMFRERQNRRLGGGVTERVKADLGEVAAVMEGAYGRLATAAGVRSAQIPNAARDLDLHHAAEEYLIPGAFPDPPNHDLEVRAIRLGMPL